VIQLTDRETKVFWQIVQICYANNGVFMFQGSAKRGRWLPHGISMNALRNLSEKGVIDVKTVNVVPWNPNPDRRATVYTHVEISETGHLWMHGKVPSGACLDTSMYVHGTGKP
jgi:hypothetical protein